MKSSIAMIHGGDVHSLQPHHVQATASPPADVERFQRFEQQARTLENLMKGSAALPYHGY
jgi:hypothetical protein